MAPAQTPNWSGKNAPSRVVGTGPARKSFSRSAQPRAHVPPHADRWIHLYSVGAITDSAGAVKERYAYSAYGARQVLAPDGIQRTASLHNQFISYTGRRLDPETSLHYFRARYFDAKLGRFIGRDPLGYVDGMSLNQAYFAANYVDPTGAIRLSYRTTGLPKWGKCDTRMMWKPWVIEWDFVGDDLKDIDDTLYFRKNRMQGVIAQRIIRKSTVFNCDGKEIDWDGDYNYTEFWGFDEFDGVFSASGGGGSDTWNIAAKPFDNTKGSYVIIGLATFTTNFRFSQLHDIGARPSPGHPAGELPIVSFPLRKCP
jgi:RHS repeat-associated protein